MRSRVVAAIVAICWILGSAMAQTAEVDLGVLACSFEIPRANEGNAPSTEGQTREVLCSFKPRNGAEETYVGIVRVMSLSSAKATTALWTVRGSAGTQLVPGLLQQSYEIDQTAAADQSPLMIGETNSGIVLRSMADKQEGSVSAGERSPPIGFVVLGIELTLASTTG
jgi:Protein of unknown function (DUF992)